MSSTVHRHRGTPKQRLTAPETRFVVAVSTLTALLMIALVRHLVSAVAG
ncbi:hypothetical protein [Nocardioides conyzicola]